MCSVKYMRKGKGGQKDGDGLRRTETDGDGWVWIDTDRYIWIRTDIIFVHVFDMWQKSCYLCLNGSKRTV